MTSARLGAIAFVNALPVMMDFTWPPGFDAPQTLVASPAELNAALLDGRLDVSAISSACYLRHQDELALLPDLSISSPGAVESVLFISRHAPGDARFAPAFIPTPDDSETSIALLVHLLRRQTGEDFSARMRPYPAARFEEALERDGCALIIGDRALMVGEAHFARPPWHVCDLSGWWRRQTGLPFVFAVWAARRAFVREQPELCLAMAQALRASRQRFFQDDRLFRQGVSLAASRSGVSRKRLERYYRHCLNYELTPAHRESLELFAQTMDIPSASRGLWGAGVCDVA